jgi:hypothetical protein
MNDDKLNFGVSVCFPDSRCLPFEFDGHLTCIKTRDSKKRVETLKRMITCAFPTCQVCSDTALPDIVRPQE